MLIEYCLDRGVHFLIPSGDNWNSNTVVSTALYSIMGLETDNGGLLWEIRPKYFSLSAALLQRVSGKYDGHLPSRSMNPR